MDAVCFEKLSCEEVMSIEFREETEKTQSQGWPVTAKQKGVKR